jgi:hypothetical protein
MPVNSVTRSGEEEVANDAAENEDEDDGYDGEVGGNEGIEENHHDDVDVEPTKQQQTAAVASRPLQPAAVGRRQPKRRRGVRGINEALDSRTALVSAVFAPKEFTRRMSVLSKCTSWKAVEARQFFLYLAYGIFAGILDKEGLVLISLLQCYMFLVCGTDPNPIAEENLVFAERIAELFIAKLIHARQRGVYITTHGLLHIPRDCRFFNCHGERNSTLKFENKQRATKNMVTSGFCKLSQIRTRLIEKEKFVFYRDEEDRIIRNPSGEPAIGSEIRAWFNRRNKRRGDLSQGFVVRVGKRGVKEIRFDGFVLECGGFKDSFCLVKEAESVYSIVRVTDVVEELFDESDGLGAKLVYIRGVQYRNPRDLFMEPAPSTHHHVYLFSSPELDSAGPDICWDIHQVVGKLYVFPHFPSIPVPTRVLLGHEKLDVRVLGDEASFFPNVPDWIGSLLRHSGLGEQRSSLY